MSLRPATTAFGVSLALLLVLCALAANAQSGRRQAKPPAVAPVPTPTPEPAASPKPKRDENAINFVVATSDRATTISRAPLTFHDAARDGCAEQLRKRTSLDVDVAQRDMTRGEAIAKAKAGKTTYVVLVSIIGDSFDADNSGYTDEFEVDYVVFAPGNAKVVASGRTYENSARKGPISVPRPRGATLPSYREAALRRAGQEAADRIVKSIHLSTPPSTKVQ